MGRDWQPLLHFSGDEMRHFVQATAPPGPPRTSRLPRALTVWRRAQEFRWKDGLPLGVLRVELLGTAFTMEGDFYRGRLESHGLRVAVPDADARALVHRVIYDELVNGQVRADSREAYRRVVGDLVAAGVDGVIAGCTEIELLLGPDDVGVAWYPTTRLHVQAAVEWILAG